MAIITINPDKTISIDGKKTFPLFMYGMCSNNATLCDTALNRNSNFHFDLTHGSATDIFFRDTIVPIFQRHGQSYTHAMWIGTSPSILDNDLNFFGYIGRDEPTAGLGIYTGMTQDQMEAQLLSEYNRHKSDTNHIQVLNHWTHLWTYLPYADVISYDTYPVLDNASWDRGDSFYRYEHVTYSRSFDYITGIKKDIDLISKPVWAVIQGCAIPYNVYDGIIASLTSTEVRIMFYLPITMGFLGIGVWGYNAGYSIYPETGTGLINNPDLNKRYNDIAGEIRGFNDWLVLPTVAHSWEYNKNTTVSFNTTLSKTLWAHTFTNFNWILKQIGNVYYLIIVNKDPLPISDVGVTIQGLTGSMTATTIGLSEAGSIPGRTLPVTNGSFTDSFDGLAVHIYQIGEECLTPQCDFTITQL